MIKMNLRKEELYDLYWNKKLTSIKIAKKLKCCKATVLCWMKKYDISRRSSGEANKGRRPWNKGKKWSEETRKKMSISQKKRFKESIHPWKGKKRPKELVEKFSKMMKEKYKTGKLVVWNKGKKGIYSKEYRKKISEGNIRRFKDKRNHPNWRGGISYEPYGIEFNNQLKEYIRNKYNRICQFPDCNKKENGRRLDVHHIDYNKKNNHPSNLLPLCHSCHQQTNFKRDDWVNYFQDKVIKI